MKVNTRQQSTFWWEIWGFRGGEDSSGGLEGWHSV